MWSVFFIRSKKWSACSDSPQFFVFNSWRKNPQRTWCKIDCIQKKTFVYCLLWESNEIYTPWIKKRLDDSLWLVLGFLGGSSKSLARSFSIDVYGSGEQSSLSLSLSLYIYRDLGTGFTRKKQTHVYLLFFYRLSGQMALTGPDILSLSSFLAGR